MNTTKYKDISFYVDKVNVVVGANQSGKTCFLEDLYSGFSGGLKDRFVLDGNYLDKNSFFVYYIREWDSMENERLLGTKSLVRQSIDSEVKSLEKEQLDELNLHLSSIKELVKQYIYSGIEINYGLDIQSKININDLVSKFSEILYDELLVAEFSFSLKRLMYIDLHLKMIEQINQPCILLIDGFDNGLSDFESLTLLNKVVSFVKEIPCKVFLSTSRRYTFNHKIYVKKGVISNELINYETLTRWYAVINDEPLEDIRSLYSIDEVNEWVTSHSLLDKIEEYFLSNGNYHKDFGELLLKDCFN